MMTTGAVAFAGAFILYLFGHIVRAMKFWLIQGDADIALARIFVVFYASSVIGYFTPLYIAEPIRLLMLSLLCKRTTRVGIAYALHRALDGLVLAAGVAVLGLSNAAVAPSVQVIGFVMLVASFGTLATMYSLPRTLVPLQQLLLGRMHNRLGMSIVEAAGSLSRASRGVMAAGMVPMLPLALTVVAWALDITAVWITLSGQDWSEAASSWVAQSMRSLAQSGSDRWQGSGTIPIEQLQDRLILPQIVFCLLLLAVVWRANALKSRQGGRR